VAFLASDPIIITSVAISLLCAIFSLLYGYLYSIQLSAMQTVDKAIRWSYEAQKSSANFVWNVWVLLAMPAVSFVWSVVFLIAGIMALVWRGRRHTRISDDEALTIKVIITSLLIIAVLYLAAMMRMFNRFGSRMEWGWQRNVRESLYVAPGNVKDTSRPTTMVSSDGFSAGPSSSTGEVADLRANDVVKPGQQGIGHNVQKTTGKLNSFWAERY
jgi:magnesium-transporting ATPase (P-type)